MQGDTPTSARPIAAITVGPRYRRDVGDIETLARSIEAVGLLHPVVITPDGRLIAGQRRLAACTRLGWREVPVRVINLANLVAGEYAENVIRKDFLPSEAVAIAKALEPVERRAARERQRATQVAGRDASGAPVFGAGKLSSPSEKGQTRDKVAAYVGLSGRTLEHAAKVVEAAERNPEMFAPLVAEMDRTGRVNGIYQKLVTLQRAQALTQEPQPLPTSPFRVILADPPWHFQNYAADEPGVLHARSRGANRHYPTMSTDDICRLRIPAARDAVLFLWACWPLLPDALRVITSWGFMYKSVAWVWVKLNRSGKGFHWGTGYYTRANSEPCLLATRGNLPKPSVRDVHALIVSPVRQHSRKPDEQYSKVERLYPRGPHLELFARQQRPGWAAHGDQTTWFSAT